MVDVGETVMVTGAAELGFPLEVVPVELTESVFIFVGDMVVVVFVESVDGREVVILTGEVKSKQFVFDLYSSDLQMKICFWFNEFAKTNKIIL